MDFGYLKQKIDTPSNIVVEENIIENNFIELFYKKGDLVKIVYLEGSVLNYFKGYNGEIKMYTKNAEFAYLNLEALNNTTPIRFPLIHFIPRNDNVSKI